MKLIQKKNSGKLHLVSLLFFMSTALMVGLAVVVSFSINLMENTMVDAIQDHLVSAAQAASVLLTVEDLDLFHTAEDMERPEWNEIRAILQKFAVDHSVLYVYYWRLYGEEQIQYIIDNDEDEEYMVTPEMFFDIDEDPATAEAVPFITAGNVWATDLGVYTSSWDGLISGLAPVFNNDGSIYCVAGVDLSDEKIIAQQNLIRFMQIFLISSLFLSVLSGILALLSYRKKALQSEFANKTKSHFLATMSHEIRTPLNAVIGLSEIELQGDLSDKSRNNIQQIYMSGTSLLGIINDVLDISKIESGGFELVPVEYDTVSLIGGTINLNKVRIGSKPITFHLEIDDNFPRMLYGDEIRIKQILNNILSNAIKYTAEGSVTLEVKSKIENVKENNHDASNLLPFSSCLITFIVTDTGMGIRKENIPKLFTGYTQFDITANRKIEGTGLGLEISKKLVEMMRGSITVDSEYGKGSVFTVTIVQNLPAGSLSGIGTETAVKLRQLQYVEEEEKKQIDRTWMPYGKVLVVDDMPVNLLVAQGLLEPYGLQVDVAASGQESINKIKAGRYDLVFMDHLMPEMDGIEAVRIIRAWEKELGIDDSDTQNTNSRSPVPIIALTANAMAGNVEMFHSKGFDGFVSKPINGIELDKVLNQWIYDRKDQITMEKKQETMPEDTISPIPKIPASHNLGDGQAPDPHSLTIPGVDMAKGIAMTGGKKEFYHKILAMYKKDAIKRLTFLQTIPNGESMTDFVTQVHALKSASASIGAGQVSKQAAELEAAGKARDLALIEEKLPVFTGSLSALTEGIQAWEDSAQEQQKTGFSEKTLTLFTGLAKALESQKLETINNILDELNGTSIRQQMNPKTIDILEKIADDVLLTEFERALADVRLLLDGGVF